MQYRPARIVTIGCAVVALAVSGCGSPTTDSPTGTTPETHASDSAFPKTIQSGSGGNDITLGEAPDAIVSLSPSATETLFAVGAGSQVVAVDDQSDYPAEAPKTELSSFTPNLEAILEYAPDLVIATADMGNVTAALGAADIPTLILPAATSLDDAYSQIERIADATGHDDEGDAVVEQMRTRIDAAVSRTPDRELTYFHELDDTLYTVSSSSFVGQIYGLFGLTSIADGANSGDYPQLSAEAVITADPNVVFLADAQCCGVTAESVSARAGWSSMQAVRDGRIFAMDEDLSSRWGPRIADQVEAVADVLATLPA